MMMATLTVTTAHTFIILTVSHGLLFRQPRFARRQQRRRICSSLPNVTQIPLGCAQSEKNARS
jgi:hypothetical protein